jgi:hypothetical protein
MNNFKCDFCDNSFSSKSLLIRHQQTAKYCLKIQGINNGKPEVEKDSKIFECSDCFKTFTNKNNYKIHTQNCRATKIRVIKDEEIIKLKKEINELKQKLEITEAKLDIYKSDHECIQEIAKQPKTINTLNNNNKYMYLSPLFLTKETIKDAIETNFTKDNFLNGQKGVADFTYNNLLLDDNNNPKYICNDPNRHTFTYKNKDGKLEKDYKGTALTNLIFDDVIKKSTVISNNIINNNKEDDFIKNNCLKSMIEIKDLKNNNSEYITRLTKLVKMKENNILIKTEEDTDTEEDEDNLSLNITFDFMKEQSQFLTQEDLLNGVDGLINYSLRYPFKDRLICSEYTSKVLNYKDEENNLITDTGGFQICKQLFKSIENQYRNLYEEYKMYINDECNKYTSNIKCINTEEEVEKYHKEIDIMNEPLERLMDEKKEIYKIFKGEDNEYLLSFIDKLCLKTLVE